MGNQQISMLKLATVASTPRCNGERHSFPWIAPRYIPYNAEC